MTNKAPVIIGKVDEERIASGAVWKRMILEDDMFRDGLGTKMARAVLSIDEVLNLHPPYCQGWIEITKNNILAVDFCASCEDRVMEWWRKLYDD